ncbi:MAG: hypothetical protein LIP12_10045 [Clostridiales bacterium]|nr:hypothetical protein [Clostridiales bacterium]
MEKLKPNIPYRVTKGSIDGIFHTGDIFWFSEKEDIICFPDGALEEWPDDFEFELACDYELICTRWSQKLKRKEDCNES